MSSISLPFRIKSVFEGLAESNGLLISNRDGLKIQIQTKDAIFGAIKSDVKEINIPLVQIEEIGFKKGIFGSKLTLRVADLFLLEDVPGQDSGEITVSIDKKNVAKAEKFVASVSRESADLQHQKDFDEELGDE